MTERQVAAAVWVAGLLALAGAARGQDQPAPGRGEPPPIRPSAPGAPAPASVPGRAVPGLEDADHHIKPPALLREGSFIVRRPGSMVSLPSGERVLVFHRDAQGQAERPMVLIPCQTLQRMEQTAGEESPVFVVSGEVFVYRGVNYLLPNAAPLEPGRPAPQRDQEPAPGEASPEVRDLIARLEAQRDRPRTIESAPRPVPEGPAATGGSARPGLIPENRALTRRTGRLTRTGAGDWALSFDTGAAGEPELDRPMILAPCLTLQQMEAIAAREGDGARLEVSGRILAYQNRNYLIPTLFRVVEDAELRPRP